MDLYGSYDPIGLTSDGMFDIDDAWCIQLHPATNLEEKKKREAEEKANQCQAS